MEGIGESPSGEMLFELMQPWIDFSDTKMNDDEIAEWLEKRGRGWDVGDAFFHNYVSTAVSFLLILPTIGSGSQSNDLKQAE